MESKKIICSLQDHSKEEAYFFCPECKIYMCNKCNKSHSELLKNFHHQFKLKEDNNDDNFTGLCKEKNHFEEIVYFCKTHNILCCALCIVKIKDEKYGKHSDCDVCKISEIEEEKKSKLKENIQNLENLSKNLEDSIKELKIIKNEGAENKENLKITIQKIFTKIRNEINERESELLLEVDKINDDFSLEKEKINNFEKFPKILESSLNKGKLLENQWNENKLNFSINICLNVEKSIKEINTFNDILKNNYNNKIIIKFEPEENEINPFLEKIQKFGNIYSYQNFLLKLNSIEDIETYLTMINEGKEKIFKYCIQNKDKYFKFKPFEIKSNLILIEKDKNKIGDRIIHLLESIINFSKEKKIFLIFLNTNFWIKLLKYNNEPNLPCIDFCHKLRQKFIYYRDLINEILTDDNDSNYKEEINRYYEKDEFAYALDKNVIKLIETKKLNNSEIIGCITKFDPYYNIYDKNDNQKYENLRDIKIFDFINFDNVSDWFDFHSCFIQTFRKMKFESIFKNEITGYLNKLISKIINIPTFGLILKLIDIENIGKKINEYIELLKEKYEDCIKKEIDTLKGEELYKAIKIISEFVLILYIKENSYIFLEKNIKKLDKKKINLIYKELLRISKGEQYKKIKEFIFQDCLKDLDIDNIINFINLLEKEEKSEFIIFLIDTCKFTKEEFFSNENNINIDLISRIIKTGLVNIFEKAIKIPSHFERLMDEIYYDLKERKMTKKNLEEFLSNKDEVIKRLNLIKLIHSDFSPNDLYDKLNNIILEINELTFIRDSLLLYHRDIYKREIDEISHFIKKWQEENIGNYEDIMDNIMIFRPLCDQIQKVKDFLLFKLIFDNSYERNEKNPFDSSINKLNILKELFNNNTSVNDIYLQNKNIFDKIKIILINNEEEAKNLMNKIKDYFKINKEELINDLSIILYSKKYEYEVKSIAYFFNNFLKDNKINEILPKKYQSFPEDLKEIKEYLHYLKKNEIYNYKENNYFCKIFTSLYQKKEAIDFLESKIDKENEIKTLYNKLDPINGIYNIKNIQDMEECLIIFKACKKLNDFHKIIKYLKNLNSMQIERFIAYSKNYSAIIDLERNFDIYKNVFDNVNNIITKAKLILKLDENDFTYGDNNKTISLDKLIDIKNEIPPLKNIETEENNLNEKIKKLIAFKNIIINLEEIYNIMKILKQKGSNLPINISLQINYRNKIYKINDVEKSLKEIKEFLFKAKSNYIEQLDSFYFQNKYIRFLFGNLFKKILLHLENKIDIDEILRFILNETNNKNKIIDCDILQKKLEKNYLEHYINITQNSFTNISNYIASLFEKNNTSLQKHYEKMLFKGENIFKGIYLKICENESKEEFILKLFMDKIGLLPIAQNILYCGKETSFEEMQAFFNRSILCEYNTLFLVVINNSFSNYQQNIMFTYINKLLLYKNNSYNNLTEKNIEKEITNLYLNSCIVFIYDKNNKNNVSFINDNIKFNEIQNENIQNIKLNNISKNIKVFTSDISGLGKTHQIKKIIKENKKLYSHFTLGGNLSKKLSLKN